MAHHLESLFERYRTRGDVGALGDVFDQTAGELFRLAVHLSRDPTVAEDVLQQTFLAAIEKRDGYDASRPLLPWLTGILSNMARRAWRERARRPDVTRLAQADGEPGTPPRGEAEDEVLQAMERLRSPYREVVILGLRFGMKPAEIALALDRDPGTVRTQLQRGLEKLRARLPVGLRVGLVPAMQGLDTVRDLVLAEAASCAATAAATTTTTLALGALVVTKKTVTAAALLLLLLLLLSAGGVLLLSHPEGEVLDEPTAGTTTGGLPARANVPDAPPSQRGSEARQGVDVDRDARDERDLARPNGGAVRDGETGPDSLIGTLLWVIEHEAPLHQDLESAAYLALAKVAYREEHVEVLMRGVDRERPLQPVVRRSAVLALGLLRRTDPGRRFSSATIERVKLRLFRVFEDKGYDVQARASATVAIGLLADQSVDPAEAAGTTELLFKLLEREYPNGNLYVGLILAIGLQPPSSVTARQRDVLGTCALKGRLYRHAASDLTRAHAANTLGRIGTKSEIQVLENILAAKRGVDRNVKRSAAIGLGLLGRNVSGDDRVAVAQVLLESIKKIKDNSAKNFATISLAYLLIEDIKRRTTDVFGGTEADEYLLETAARGKYLYKGFGALALGLVLRNLEDDLGIAEYQDFRKKALAVLREGVANKQMDKKTRAAFCTAIGTARDKASRPALVAVVADRKGDKRLRSYAALGLGLIGEPTPRVLEVIAQAMAERSSEDLRRQSAVALGLLGNREIPSMGQAAVDLLLKELEEARTTSHKGQVVLALAQLGDRRALARLIELVKTEHEDDLTRALACAGLGRIGDPEPTPSLDRAIKDLNYRASTRWLNELRSIL